MPFLSEKRWLKHRSCAICLEDFPKTHSQETSHPSEDYSIIRLPCHHLYHKKCIHQWLKASCTCPSCRYELLTENEDYNVGIRERMAIRDLELGEDTDEEEEDSNPVKESNETDGKKRKSDDSSSSRESKRQKT